ncbi:MAG: ImmA/IrrE family metallo-endopeptidase [Ruminococcaceae bacterium]|nr:ImmA/IrrE family metallo-endopeptidase [Oscillospiraceae bacterium]
MFDLSQFYSYCQQNAVDVIPYAGMPAPGATIRDGEDIAIFLDVQSIGTLRQLKGICLHELGHAATGALHKVSSPYETVGRSEYRANRWAAQQYLSVEAFYEAFDAGCRDLWELAEYFDLPEQDVKNALTYWTEQREVVFSKE